MKNLGAVVGFMGLSGSIPLERESPLKVRKAKFGAGWTIYKKEKRGGKRG